MVEIRMFPAQKGDFIWIRYGIDKDMHNIVIDGGEAESYKVYTALLSYIKSKSEMIEAIIITHIDVDHIMGALQGIQNYKGKINFIKKIYLNTAEAVAAELIKRNKLDKNFEVKNVKNKIKIRNSHNYGVAESCSLIELLDLKRNQLENIKELPGNIFELVEFVESGTIHYVEGGVTLKFISPDEKRLENFAKHWKDEYDKMIKKEKEKNLLYTSREKEKFNDIDSYEKDKAVYDSSKTNGSSLGFIFEYKHPTCEKQNVNGAFLADAYANVCVNGIKEIYKDSIEVDFIKISHHGSIANINEMLLKYIKTNVFLLSTNGDDKKPAKAIFHHLLKDKESIKMYCNYKWWERSDKKDFFTTIDKKKYINSKILEVCYLNTKFINIKEGLKIGGNCRFN